MPSKKGDAEITIPTFVSMQFLHAEDEAQIIIKSTTGTITIRCFSHHLERPVKDEDSQND